MSKNPFHTADQIKTLTLKLSLAEGTTIGEVQGKRFRLTVPMNGLSFDQHGGLAAKFFTLDLPQLGSASTPAPAGVTLYPTGSNVLAGSDATNPRLAILSRLVCELQIASDAETFADIPLILKGANSTTEEARAPISLPEFTATPDSPFAVTDLDGGPVDIGWEEVATAAGTGGSAGVTVSSTAPSSPSNGALWLDTSGSPFILKVWKSSGSTWIEFESTGGGESVKPAFASASINSAGDTLTVNLTEAGSPPILPASAITGFTLGGVSGRSIGNGTRIDDDTITFAISGGAVLSGESPTVSYSPGNVTDSANVPNAMDAFSGQAVTNNSTEEASLVAPTIWLRADNLGLSDETELTAWNDVSGNGHHPTLNGGGSSGKFFDTNVQNGLAGVRWDTTAPVTFGDLSSVFASAATVIIVANVNDGDYALWSHKAVDDTFWHHPGSGGIGYLGTFRTARINSYPGSPTPSSGAHMFSLVSSATRYEFFVDGASQGAQTASYQAGTSHQLGKSSSASQFAGHIFEVLLFDTELADADREAWEAALTTKWGL